MARKPDAAARRAKTEPPKEAPDLEPVVEVSKREIEDIEERSSPRIPVIYEIVRRLGEEEMARPAIRSGGPVSPRVSRSAFRF
ncbi:MAG: hypothetical protein ACREC1_00090 [Methylovirgula sp.]